MSIAAMSYAVRRTGRKTIAVEVLRDGTVLVRAPLPATDAQIERFVSQKREWIERAQARQAQRLALHPEPSPEQVRALREEAARILPELVRRFAARMGVSPASVRITAARTRFGSCSPQNGLCFSLYLMQYPREAVDYVVVHELAHILHKNHGPAFHACVAAMLPDHRARRALLRR